MDQYIIKEIDKLETEVEQLKNEDIHYNRIAINILTEQAEFLKGLINKEEV